MATRIQKYLQNICNALPVAVYIKDVQDDFKYLLWNSEASKLWELPENEVLGKTDFEIHVKEKASRIRIKDLDDSNSQMVIYTPEQKIIGQNDQEIWIRSWRQVIYNEVGEPALLVTIAQDITLTKKAIDESNLQRQQLQSISDNAPGVLYQFRVTPENIMSFTYISRKFKDMFGVDPQEVMGRSEHMFELLHPDDRADFFVVLQDTIDSRSAWHWEGRMLNSAGEERFVQVHSNPYLADDGCVYWDGMFQDLTELKEKERLLREQTEKMHQAARLVSLGEMAGGVAHEINTPLGAIAILSEVATREVTKSDLNKDKVVKQLSQINDMVFRISKIIKAMRSYARKESDDDHERTSLLSIVEEVLAVSNHRLKQEQVKVDISRLPSDLFIKCQATQISQVLLNLINNSCDAIRDLEQKWISFEVRSNNEESLEISITDSGGGIPADVANKLFENFFTTKGPKEGTGLGLSMSKNIMKTHAGDLYLDQESSHTCFVLKFPKKKQVETSAA